MRVLCRLPISTLCLSLALVGACNDSRSANPALSDDTGSGSPLADAGADASDAGPTPEALAFQPSDTLTLSPKASQTLTVVASPAGNFRVRFALLGSGSADSPGDAALDASEVATDDNGVAQVTLTAPTMPTTFNVRASVAKARIFLGVSVTARNDTALVVLPSYSGVRSVTQWTATVAESKGKTCAELVGNPPPDGTWTATAAAGQPVSISHVPIGVDLIVTLRAGHFVGGCANQSALNETDDNEVLVYASDRPLNLDATELNLNFGPTQPKPALSKLMNGAANLAVNALSNGSASDVTALLDAMATNTAVAKQPAFAAARTSHSWDAAVSSALGNNSATRLRDPAGRWLNAGLARFYASDTFSSRLSALTNGALLALATVAQIPAASAGFPTSFQATWSADSSDTLLFGSTLTWVPSRLATSLAVAPALAEFPGALTLEAALAQSVDCSLVGTTLVVHGSIAGSAAYDGCDSTCATKACAAAVASLWQGASNASGRTNATLSVTGSGRARVGDDASVTSLGGNWVGELQVGTDTAPASGTLSATASVN